VSYQDPTHLKFYDFTVIRRVEQNARSSGGGGRSPAWLIWL
jgi:hypothetical protein